MTKDSWRAMLVFWWQAGVLPSTQLINAAFAKPRGLIMLAGLIRKGRL